MARCEISGVGVAGDDAIDACLLMAIDETIRVGDRRLGKYLLLERDGVVMSSVFMRWRALAALGEAASMFMVSGLYGGTFSLFESPSAAVIDMRMRFGFGVGSGV